MNAQAVTRETVGYHVIASVMTEGNEDPRDFFPVDDAAWAKKEMLEAKDVGDGATHTTYDLGVLSMAEFDAFYALGDYDFQGREKKPPGTRAGDSARHCWNWLTLTAALWVFPVLRDEDNATESDWKAAKAALLARCYRQGLAGAFLTHVGKAMKGWLGQKEDHPSTGG